MKILVSGGAGYIGSCLVPKLLEKKYEVTVLDNFYYNQNSLNSSCIYKNLKLINGDVRDLKLLKKIVKDQDLIIPLAALVGAPICSKKEFEAQTINVDSMMALFDMVSSSQQIIMPTTNSAYGTGDKDNYCDENTNLNPISKYAIDKVAVEKVLMDRENSVSLRLATVFGLSNRMRLDLLVNDFTYRAFNDKYIILFESSFKRNYIHVRDVVKVFMHTILRFDKMKQNIFNVGLSDANLSKKELCEKIKLVIPEFFYSEASHKKDPDQRNYIVSNKKIEATGFKPDYSILDGINELVKGFTYIKNNKFTNI